MNAVDWNDFLEYLRVESQSVGKALEDAADDMGAYALERAEHLAEIINEPGWEQALLAERDNVALRAGINMVHEADAIDVRLNGILEGALAFAAGIL